MSLPLLRPLLLTVGATSLVFFGGVIALAVQSPEEPVNNLSAPTLSTPNLVTQNADITSTSSDSSSFKAVENSLSQFPSTKQSSLAALTPAQATALAKQQAPSAILQATPELINYNGTVAYEVRLDNGTTYIDANLGAVLNPVATNNCYVEDYDEDDDDKHKDEKHSKRKHDDDYKDNERLIATSYQQHDEESYDD